MSMLHLDYLEFYISHTCNFNCQGCNRFNNFLFLGHQRWQEQEKTHKKWAKKLKLDEWCIIGGEPTLNPDIIQWIYGLRSLWPDSKGSIVTNASFKKRFDKEFYQALIDTGMRMDIGLHDKNRREEVTEMVLNFVQHPVKIVTKPLELNSIEGLQESWQRAYSAIKDPSWPSCDNIYEWNNLPSYIQDECANYHDFSREIYESRYSAIDIIDANGLEICIGLENFFYSPALIRQEEKNNFTLHNSNPKRAHDVCMSKYCHHMADGKLSKCAQADLFPKFSKQFQVELSTEDKSLVDAYEPLGIDADMAVAQQFIDNIKDPIAQCKFCPEYYAPKEINSSINKDKFGVRI